MPCWWIFLCTTLTWDPFLAHDELLEGHSGAPDVQTGTRSSEDSYADEPTEQSPLLPPRTYHATARPSTWRQATLTILALLHVTGGLIRLVSDIKHVSEGSGAVFGLVATSVFLLAWIYAALQVNFQPSCTPYYDIFALYTSELLAVLTHAYEYFHRTGYEKLEFGLFMVALQAFWSFAGIAAIVTMPLNVVRRPQMDKVSR